MPIQTILRDVEFATDKPLCEWRVPVENFFPRRAPDQLARFARPEFGRLLNRLSIHSSILFETFDSRVFCVILLCFENTIFDQVPSNIGVHEQSLISRID